MALISPPPRPIPSPESELYALDCSASILPLTALGGGVLNASAGSCPIEANDEPVGDVGLSAMLDRGDSFLIFLDPPFVCKLGFSFRRRWTGAPSFLAFERANLSPQLSKNV